jgi:hypothetical protein
LKGQEREEDGGGDRPKRKKEARDGGKNGSPGGREIVEGIGGATDTPAAPEYSEWVEVKWQREQPSCLCPSGWWWKAPAKRKKAKEMERNKKDFRFMELSLAILGRSLRGAPGACPFPQQGKLPGGAIRLLALAPAGERGEILRGPS